MKDDIASNWSHSVMAPVSKIPWACEIHSKPPKKFGEFLTTDFGKEFEKSNIPCDCQCSKCKGYNRYLLNEGKIERIKKRIQKAALKMERNEEPGSLRPQNTPPMSYHPKSYVHDEKNADESLKLINNLSGLKLLLKISKSNNENGKPPPSCF